MKWSISVVFQAKGREIFPGGWVVIDMEAIADFDGYESG